MTWVRCLSVLSIVSVCLLAAVPALADGVIIPDPPPGPEPLPLRDTWLTIRYNRVSVSIDRQVAVTRIEQEFLNEHEWEAEGTYIFPLPERASVSEFTMWVDGEPVESQILEAGEAREIYEGIVRRRRDPALLEYVGRRAVKARIFPIPPGGSRKVELEYTEVLPVDNGLVRYVYPLSTAGSAERFSARPLEQCSVHVDVRSEDAMHAIYSPTHQDRVSIQREGDHRATVGYEEVDVLPDQDFELVYTVSQEDVGLNLLTFQEAEDRGFFLLLAAPTVGVASERVVPRDVILVLDTSGSMEGEKLAQAKGALTYVLRHLNQEDRFNVLAFSSGLSRYAGDLRPASEAPRAANWVQDLEAIGGTNINRALLEALSLTGDEPHGEDRPVVLIFLTDGLPTEGVTEIERILANVESGAPKNVRLFPFGVGDDVNTILLDALAEQNRGAASYVRPHERIDEEVSGFYAKIKTPVLTDLALDFGDVMVEDIYPTSLPDLFAGTQLILTGRYRLPPSHRGDTRIRLSGRVGDAPREFIYEATSGGAPDIGADDGSTEPTASFIPRLWATRKIGHLLTQIRLHGEKEEWVDAVVDLSVRYGIITPYTSFLISDEDILTAAGREEAAKEYMAMPTPAASGAPAVEMAEEEAEMRSADSAAPSTGSGGGAAGEGERAVRHVGARTFVLEDGVWMDTAFDPDAMETEKVAFGSEGYFDLLAAWPAWGDYLALGEHVIFVAEVDGAPVAYEIVTDGESTVQVPPTETARPPRPTLTGEPTEDGRPTPTSADPGDALPAASSGLCPGALAVSALALAARAVLVVRGSWRHDS
jgi:Ca-activated chloride channel family protein